MSLLYPDYYYSSPQRSLQWQHTFDSCTWNNDEQFIDNDHLYALEDDSPPPPPTPPPPIKDEPNDASAAMGHFVMEQSSPRQRRSAMMSQSLAPVTKVPLRATNVPEEMLHMMSVIRIDPFNIHNGRKRGPVSAGRTKPRPLDTEPLIFEFQLDLDEHRESLESQNQPRPSSHDFELPTDEGYQSDWSGCPSEPESSTYPSTPPTQWNELAYPSNAGSVIFTDTPSDSMELENIHPRHSSRLHNSVSNPYPRKNADREHEPQVVYDQYYISSNSSPTIYPFGNHTGPTEPSQWLPRASRSGTFPSDSSGCNPIAIPSLAPVNRRWSLPDSHSASSLHAPFFG